MTNDISNKIRAAPLSMLESLDRRGDREAPTPDVSPKSIIRYYLECMERIDPNGKQALANAVSMYKQ